MNTLDERMEWTKDTVRAVRVLEVLYGPSEPVGDPLGTIWLDSVFIYWNKDGRRVMALRFDIGNDAEAKARRDALRDALDVKGKRP